jgi:hypothetical protein
MMIMNKKRYTVLLFIASGLLAALASCDRSHYDLKMASDSGIYLTIRDVKSIYQGQDIKLGKDIDKIYGTVISDAASGNIPRGYLVIQQGPAGIAIALKDSSGKMSFVPGDSVTVNIEGASLIKENGNMMISGPSLSDVTKLGKGSPIKPTPVLLEALVNHFDTYNETLIKVAAADIVPTPAAEETYSGSKGLSDGSTGPGQIHLYTFPGSALADSLALSNASYTGIAMYGNAPASTDSLEKQLWLRNYSDISNTSIPLTSDIIITGIMADPRGSDEKVKGNVTNYSTGVTIVHKGGYEYIQLMALKDIDFSKTPYSVVVCTNGAATSKGWAEGGKTTFKFNLTQGSATQGTFFYVGSAAKVIAGYWPDGLSTDISGANWIRAIQVDLGNTSKVAGDGFGNSTTGLLSNSGPADGVAVFKGTEVTGSTVPVDAVFFNSPVGAALNGGNGYLIPASSDLYSAVNKKTGAKQPLFGEGTNTFVVEGGTGGDDSQFMQMGGVLSQNGWIVTRHPTIEVLNRTSPLSAIEDGGGVTFFRK